MAMKMERMSITPAKNGGWSISHHFAPKAEISRGRTGGGMAMITPKVDDYAFGPRQGNEAMAHVAKHTGMSQERADEAEVGGRISRAPSMRAAKQSEEEVGGEE